MQIRQQPTEAQLKQAAAAVTWLLNAAHPAATDPRAKGRKCGVVVTGHTPGNQLPELAESLVAQGYLEHLRERSGEIKRDVYVLTGPGLALFDRPPEATWEEQLEMAYRWLITRHVAD